MNVPDWLWQELAADAIWTSIAFGAAWAYRHREVLADKLGRTPRDIVINAQPLTLHAEVPPARIKVGKSVDLRWKVEASTPSLARRLEELASWYLHVS
jgi:hypothetical protein